MTVSEIVNVMTEYKQAGINVLYSGYPLTFTHISACLLLQSHFLITFLNADSAECCPSFWGQEE